MKIELFSIKMYLIYTTGTKAKCEICEVYIAAVASWKASTKIRLQNRQYTSRTWTKFGLSQPEHSNNFLFIICIICNNIKDTKGPTVSWTKSHQEQGPKHIPFNVHNRLLQKEYKTPIKCPNGANLCISSTYSFWKSL